MVKKHFSYPVVVVVGITINWWKGWENQEFQALTKSGAQVEESDYFFFHRILLLLNRLTFQSPIREHSWIWQILPLFREEDTYKNDFNLKTKVASCYSCKMGTFYYNMELCFPFVSKCSILMRLNSSISNTLFNIYDSSLDSPIPIEEVFDCFAIKRILTILCSWLLILTCKICQHLFDKFLFEIVMCFVTIRTITFRGHSWFIAIMK